MSDDGANTGNAAATESVRARLRLDAQHEVVLALPPVARATGTFIAAWAVMLVEKIRPSVRLLVSADGPERERVQRLVEACRHEHVARFVGPDVPLADLLAAADLAAFLPAGAADTASIAQAVTAGCPIVATAVPAVTELLGEGETAWLCRPNSPQDAARQMLLVLESPADMRRRADRARSHVCKHFGTERMVQAYSDVYGRLTAPECVRNPTPP